MFSVTIETTFSCISGKEDNLAKPKFLENSYPENTYLEFSVPNFCDFWLNGSHSENSAVSGFSGNFTRNYLDY